MHQFDDLNLHKHLDDKPLPYDTTEYANNLESKLKINHINEHQIQIEQLNKYISKIESKSNRLEIDYQSIEFENGKMKEKLEVQQKMMQNQEEKLKETELWYNDIKCDQESLETKARQLEKENNEIKQKITQLEIENKDIDERANHFCTLQQNESERCQSEVEMRDNVIQRLRANVENLEATLNEFYSDQGDVLIKNKELEEKNI